ncbi:hypothetical protein GCM10025880_43510 [Methylorubrum aminovorans]|nr:hypothetical protein [Methylorubrum aminovorans]GMA77934.1 hypothetical protein GCM10025880_43510 [Methylorubrum aminovorans]
MNPFRLTEKDVVIIDGVRFAPATLLVNGIALRPEGGEHPNRTSGTS